MCVQSFLTFKIKITKQQQGSVVNAKGNVNAGKNQVRDITAKATMFLRASCRYRLFSIKLIQSIPGWVHVLPMGTSFLGCSSRHKETQNL